MLFKQQAWEEKEVKSLVRKNSVRGKGERENSAYGPNLGGGKASLEVLKDFGMGNSKKKREETPGVKTGEKRGKILLIRKLLERFQWEKDARLKTESKSS